MGPELALDEAFLRLGLVAVLAGAIGVEREIRDQDAGLRTHMLVGVGAALFVLDRIHGARAYDRRLPLGGRGDRRRRRLG